MVLGGYPVAMLANVAMRQWLASPQRRSRAATDWPGVRPISSARCPIPMPIPTREPLPLGRRSDRAWLAPTWCIGRTATFRCMATRESQRARPMRADPPRRTNASGTSADAPPGRCAIASSAASDGRGGRAYWHAVPPSLLVARPQSAAPRRGRLVRALGQRPTRARSDAPLGCRGSDHAAEHHGVRSLPIGARGAALRLLRRRFTGCPRPPPYPPPPSPPAYLSRPSCRAPCHWPTSLGRPKQQPHDPPLPHPNAAPLWPTL